MPTHPLRAASGLGIALLALLIGTGVARAQMGVVLSGQGAVNRSMAGASTAAAVDASGALYWNPATISALNRSEMEFGLEELYPQTRVSSVVPAGTLGPGFPPRTLAGSDRGENGLFTLPSFGFVFAPSDPDWTFGLGVFAAGGFGVNYPASTVNPVLARPPFGVGQGAIYTQFQVLQIVPTAAYQLTERLSIGAAPILDLGLLQVDPGIVAPPDVQPNGQTVYPALTHTRYAFGGGFQIGISYAIDDAWRLGASFKSPQWFEPFRFHSTDATGQPRTDTFHLNYPMIVSTGVAYSGFDRWLVAGDLRYIDYRDTTGFRESGFDARGALRGVGWDSIFGVALGAQYRATDYLSLRMGYAYNENPIDDAQASANIGSSTLQQHAISAGASYRIADGVSLSLAYVHFFGNSIEGPLVSPRGPIPGTSVKDAVISVDSLVAGLSVQFGAPRK